MALHGPGSRKRRRGSLNDVTRSGCANAPPRPVAPEASTPLEQPLKDGEPDGSAGSVKRLGRAKRHRSIGQYGTGKRGGANGFHAEAPPTTGGNGWTDAFVNKTDVVHDALLSALGGRMSASAQDVQAYVALRRAPYGTDRVVMALAPDCTRTVKRLLYCSDRFRVVRKPGGSLLDGPRGTHEFQLARSGGSVPRTLSMQQLAFGQRRTPPPGNKRSGSRLSLPVEHPRKQKSASPAAPAVQQSRLDTAAIGMPPTTDPAPFPHLGDCHEMPPLSARTDSDAATSKVTAEFPEDKKAAGQPAFDGTCSARARTAKTETRGDAPPIDTSNVSPLDGLQAESSLADSLVGVGPLDFSADFHALLPPHIQGLPLMNEAEEDLSEQLLNFQEWETSFGWPCT